MADTTTTYRPRAYRRLCDVCGNLRNIDEMHKQDELWVCSYDQGERVRTELDRGNARQRPFTIKPVPYPKPQDLYYPNALETDDAAVFNFLARQVAAQCRFERVESGQAAYTAVDQAVPGLSWAARYYYDLIQENSRKLLIEKAKTILGQIADFLLTRQYGSLTGPSPSSTLAGDPFFGGFLESGAATFVTQDTATSGLALIYAYRVLGVAKYIVGARSAASYLRNVQAIGSNGTHYTSIDAAGSGRLYTGSLASEVSTTSGFYSNSLFYPSALVALEFWNELKTTDGDQAIGCTGTPTGFTSIPSQLMSTSMTDLRSCWETGITDSTGTLVNGLSSTTPKEVFNAYPSGKPNFPGVIGTGLWEYVDGPSATGTQISSQNFGQALSSLFNYEGASSQVTTVSDWLRTFTSNPNFETPANTSTAVLYRGTTGTYDPTICLATLLQVRDPDDLSDTKINASSLYDWGAFGLMSRIWASRNKASFRTSRLYPLNISQRYFDGTYNDGLTSDHVILRGLSGLTLQTALSSDTVSATSTTAYPANTTTAAVSTPPIVGLCLWCGGQGSVITSQPDAGGDARCTGWTNLVYPINGHLFATLFGFGDGPYTGIDTLDGHPSLTWRFEVGNTQNLNLDDLAGTHTPTSMKDRNGNFFGYGVGETQQRTFIAVLKPRNAHNVFDITGGVVAIWGSSPNFVSIFDLSDTAGPSTAFYAFSSAFDWRSGIGTSTVLQGPNTTGGAGGVYDGAPLAVQWSTAGGTDISFKINATEVPLSPSIIDTSPTGASAWLLGNRAAGDQLSRWKGTITEIFVYDHVLSADEETQLYRYIGGRYPSIAIPETNIAMTNDAVRAAQYGRSFRESRS